MNTTFSFKRFSLLLKRFFIENKQRELVFWGMVTAVFAIFCYKPDSWTAFFLITGAVKAAKTYNQFAFTPKGMHYLLIPATHFEKLLVGVLTSTVYFFGMIAVSSFIGINIGNFVGKVIWGIQSSCDTFWLFNSDATMYIAFLLLQAYFLLGSLYFKRNALGKSLICIVIFCVGMGLLEAYLLKGMLGDYNLHHTQYLNIRMGEDMFPYANTLGKAFFILLIPFFWIVSYFRLTEKQV